MARAWNRSQRKNYGLAKICPGAWICVVDGTSEQPPRPIGWEVFCSHAVDHYHDDACSRGGLSCAWLGKKPRCVRINNMNRKKVEELSKWSRP